MTIETASRAAAVLSDPSFSVPEPSRTAIGELARLRREVSRFANGEAHAARRREVVALLDGLDPERLADDAADRTRRAIASGARDADDPRIRAVPAAVIAAAIGFADPSGVAADAEVVADAYRSGATTPQIDAAAGRLLRGAGDAAGPRPHPSIGSEPDTAALLVQLVAQAHRATGDLVARVCEAAVPGVEPATTLHEVLRHHPPVPATVRVVDGRPLEVALADPDPAAAARPAHELLAFGAGPRRCPGARQALAIAASVVETLRGSEGSC
ncbi:hypothetical protein ABIQ69_09580 [Agromyces sp. G08B096]|uniref:Cytochrome P450 n=1 Tax=Agromyces sp. G08B096 TaxID=3156399 RepID=A0AAU7W2J3_9MICO